MAHAKDIADRFIDAFNKHDESALRALHAPHTEFQAPDGVKLTDGEAVVGYSMGWLRASPMPDGPPEGPQQTDRADRKETVRQVCTGGRYENGQVSE